MIARHKKNILHVNTLGIYSNTAWQQLLRVWQRTLLIIYLILAGEADQGGSEDVQIV